ncbi:hypothetical protein [Thiolapillus sp.]
MQRRDVLEIFNQRFLQTNGNHLQIQGGIDTGIICLGYGHKFLISAQVPFVPGIF